MMTRVTTLAIVGMLTAGSTISAQDDSDWRRVFEISHGAEVRIETETTAAHVCLFLAADDRGVTVVNISTLPRSARRVVADAAESHPDRLLNTGTLYVEGAVRIDRDGVWVGSHLVAPRARVVQRIDKPDVREIRYAGSGGTNGKRGAIIGLVAGAAATYYGSIWSCGPGAVPSECHGIAMMLTPVGAGAGAAIGYLMGQHAKRPPSDIIYRRP